MKTFENREEGPGARRSHPWTTASANRTYRYYDFRARPDLIPAVLEDFRPWDAHEAVASFYDLLAWINGPASPFESNDCAFSGPEDNVDPEFPKRLQCSGRLGLLFRDLRLNTHESTVIGLIAAIHERLRTLDPEFADGAVGTTRLRVDYLALPEGHAQGSQVLISFWAFGDDEADVFENLSRVIAALRTTLESPITA